MIIACPACSTRYVVPDSAIGVDGRTVRCAKCRHSWHQDGPELDLATLKSVQEAPPPRPGFEGVQRTQPRDPSPVAQTPQPFPTPTPAPAPAPSPTEAVQDEPPHPPPPVHRRADAASEAEQERDTPPPLVETAPAPLPDPDYDDYSQFDSEPPFRGRRNPLKVWTAAAALFALIATGLVVAVSYYGLPDWVPVSRSLFGPNQPDLVLDFPPDKQDRRALPNGTEFFAANGTITNVGRETRTVPSILIVMRDQRNKLVYSWEVVPQQGTLAPGESVTINEIKRDVPKSAKYAEFGWKAMR